MRRDEDWEVTWNSQSNFDLCPIHGAEWLLRRGMQKSASIKCLPPLLGTPEFNVKVMPATIVLEVPADPSTRAGRRQTAQHFLAAVLVAGFV